MTLHRPPTALAAFLLVTLSPIQGQTEDPVVSLERFIARERALVQGTEDLLPTARPVSGLYGEDLPVFEIPRSVTVLNAETLKQFGIRSFAELGRLGAGTQQPNFYGMAGTPTLRGAKASTYFDGLQRAYQRNEIPLSLGSAEAMDLIKGPAPGHFGPGLVGGYVNLIPKSPYFDRSRQSVTLEVGTFERVQVQLDAGGPGLLGTWPAAYRVSLTAQRAGSYYDRIRNDFVSLYAAVKSDWRRDVQLQTGAEVFRFESNENAGWNRPTQQLIDSGHYVVGEPLDITSPAWGGYADRNALAQNPALVIPRELVDQAVQKGSLSASQRALLNDLNTEAGRKAAYGSISPYLQNPGTGYQYTPAYLAAGGTVFTAPIAAHQVLADERDFADSLNAFWYLRLEGRRNPECSWRSQTLLEFLDTDKQSSYGYAARSRQWVAEQKLSATTLFPSLPALRLTYGLSARLTQAYLLQDYSLEPFGRRDLTRGEISPNTVILTGAQTGPDGLNFWSPTAQGGANIASQLWQFGAFALAEYHPRPWLQTYFSANAGHAPFTTRYPEGVDRATASQRAALDTRDHKNYWSGSFSTSLRLHPGLRLYSTLQRGTSVDPSQGGAVFGKGNFSQNELTEVGLKGTSPKGQTFATLSFYEWRQNQFDIRTVSPELLKGRGLEVEVATRPFPDLTLLASAGHQRVRRAKALPATRSLPLTEAQWALYGGVFNSGFGPATFNPGEARQPKNNPGLIYPGTPEFQVKLQASYRLSSKLGLSGGPVYNQATWLNFDRSLRLPASTVWRFRLDWGRGSWTLALSADNAFNNQAFVGSEPVFGANTLLTKAAPREWTLLLRRQY